MNSLSFASSQRRALAHVATLASGPPVDPALRVTLNFHPDRLLRGRSVLATMAGTGVYSSQFVTGTSNGGLTARPGGDRWRWESRIFEGAYDTAPAQERPVYGALNFRRYPVGGAPRFGSAHFRLGSPALDRTTFCYPDSFCEPTDFGVASRMGLVELALADRQDVLDDYIEAQVHGPVRPDRHVEALVLDPCYRDTAVETAARRLGCPVEWHTGFRLTVDELRRHPGYRGQEYVELGAAIAVDGVLDPRIVGDAACGGRFDARAIKKVWHCLARFGHRWDAHAAMPRGPVEAGTDR
ncbi:Protein of unknown function [Streptomyces sp. 2131.1]|uniref:DUF3626 domain-containing protein n=1 Tax=Streptomyces sp. 2131.1 TaxID=1855346 RepID=UPI000895CFC3|nr:DUF3626 domain-containing protein [Streptomyces sp. 2131.1]SEB69683.1 Protein of unknown function [Streptomyces sp. 2131.1]